MEGLSAIVRGYASGVLVSFGPLLRLCVPLWQVLVLALNASSVSSSSSSRAGKDSSKTQRLMIQPQIASEAVKIG